MIPANRYDPRRADQLLQYLVSELRRTQNERKPLEQKWRKWHRLYKAQPEIEHKKFPWEGAANLVVPIMATDVDVSYARLMAMLFGPQNLWTCRPTQPEFVKFAPRLQEFLQWAQVNELGAYEAVGDFILDMCKLGTGIIKTRYHREQKMVYEYREAQTMPGQAPQFLDQHRRILWKNNPMMHHVPLENFYVPATATALENAPWCAEQISLSWGQLVNRINAGIYKNIQNLGHWWAQSKGNEAEQHKQRMDRFVPSQGDRFQPYEFWVNWDISGTGEQEALVCTIHLESNSYLRIDYNPFFNQEFPYDVARYMKQQNRFYGIGIGEMVEMCQEEISTMHNQRIDNTSVQTAQALVIQRNGSIKQDTPIYPGVKLFVDDIDREIKPISLGNGMATSSLPGEAISKQIVDDRVGISGYLTGADDPSIGYSTATIGVQQLREGTKRFDQVLREVRKCLSGVGTKVAELYQQFDQKGKVFSVMGQDDGQVVQKVLSFPLDLIRLGVNIDVTATSASYNKEVEIRTNTILMQMLTQHWGQTLQYMQLILNPQLPMELKQVAMQAVLSGNLLMRRTLDSYELQDANKIVPDLGGISGQQSVGNGLIGGAAPVGQNGLLLGGGGSMANGSGGAPNPALQQASPVSAF